MFPVYPDKESSQYGKILEEEHLSMDSSRKDTEANQRLDFFHT